MFVCRKAINIKKPWWVEFGGVCFVKEGLAQNHQHNVEVIGEISKVTYEKGYLIFLQIDLLQSTHELRVANIY